MEPIDLYGLPLERFTEQRNALARELRQAGRREEAETVAKLRKPSVAAWAVNQLVRTQRKEVDGLFGAGDALQKAQAELMSGRGDAQALRDAVEAERATLDELTARARGLLSSEGHELTAPKLEQVSETLHAAALDQEARDLVRDGCLERELRHIGLGALAPGSEASGRPGTKQPRTRAKKDQKAEARRRLEKAEAEARRWLERAEREAGQAEQRRERAAESLREAEKALGAAQEAVAKARHEHDQASRGLKAT